MYRLMKTARVLLLAAASVYPVSALAANADKQGSAGKAATDVRLLDETAGPLAAADTGSPTTQPTGGQNVGAQQVNVSDAGTVEIHVNDANLVEVLRMLSLQSQKNIIASKEVRGTVTANLYNVTIKEALDAVLKANGYGYREKGNFIFVYGAKELAEIEKSERQVTTEVFRLFYTPAANAVNVIKPALSTDAQVSFTTAATVGISSSASEAGGNAHASEDVIVVRDYPDNLDRVRKVLKEVDRRPQQILVEATIVAARLNEDNELGIDFTVIGGVDWGKINHKNGLIQGTELPTGDGVPSDKPRTIGTGNTFTGALNPGFKVGFVTSDVSVFLNALETVTDTTVLANPKVMTLNKQRGEVLVGREDGYKTTTVTDTTAIQTVEFLKTGTRLIFRPFVGDDGYVRLEIHPEDSDGKVVAGLPSKTTTEVTTNVLVKDGNTIVIGGLFRETSAASRSQIPILGNLPLVGFLFRNQVDATVREEVIVLLTPHIVKDEAAYANASEQQRKDMEKLRVGVRRGMMPWGRERMAEAEYEKAVKEMSKARPSRKRALWHLNAATNLNPLFLEAIKMKEQLTGRELTSVDNSSIRGFVRAQIMAERAPKPTADAMSFDEIETPSQPVAEPSVAESTETATADDSATDTMDENWDEDAAAQTEAIDPETADAATELTPPAEMGDSGTLLESRENTVATEDSAPSNPSATAEGAQTSSDNAVTETDPSEVDGQPTGSDQE